MNTTLLQIIIDPIIIAIIILVGSVSIVRQGQVGVTVLFGRYRRILRPGLSFRIPYVETIYKKMSLQHRSAELEFQAITGDQANVDFKALIIYAVDGEEEETIKKAAFRFIDEVSFMQALVRSIEGSIRALVATRRQTEILGLRGEIVEEVHAQIGDELRDWGFRLINLQINDIAFDEAIMRSMAQVVATSNMKAATMNEAESQYISKTRVAAAEAEAKRLLAEAERDAYRLRGEGNAQMRAAIARGLIEADQAMDEHRVDASAMPFTMWLAALENVAARGHGNFMTFDGSLEGFDKTVRQMSAMTRIPAVSPGGRGGTEVSRTG